MILQVLLNNQIFRFASDKIRLDDGLVVRVLDPVKELLAVLGVIREHGVDDLALRSLAQPLEKRNIAELIRSENLEHLDGFVADILDKVTHVLGYDSDISRLIIECAGCARRAEDSHAGPPTDKE